MANFVAGTTLAAADLNAALENYQPVNPQTGTTYTLALTDAGGLVTASNSAAQAYTVPPNSSVAFDTGVHIDILNIGSERVTLTPGSGVTINGATVIPPKARAHLIKQGTNTWYAQYVPAAPGPVLLRILSPSAASTISTDNVFTTAFGRYLVEYDLTHSTTTVGVQLRMRASAADDSSANYADQYVQGAGASAGAAQNTGATSARVAFCTTNNGWGTFELWNPATAVATKGVGINAYSITSPAVQSLAFAHNVATAYDGMTLFPTSGTFTGTIRIYGIPTAL